MSEAKFTDDANSGRVFPDADLKRLKELCDSMDGKFESWNFVETDGKLIKALLARLEAAEAYASYAGMTAIDAKADELEKAWRKAAGKSSATPQVGPEGL